MCDFYLFSQDHEASEEYALMSLISTQLRFLTIHRDSTKDNKHTYGYQKNTLKSLLCAISLSSFFICPPILGQPSSLEVCNWT